jgi:type III secretory pathway component EscR
MLSFSFDFFIHLFSYIGLFFVVGMIKPKWALFFMKVPSRILVMSISMIAFMTVMTFYGEWNKEKMLQEKKSVENSAPVSELPAVK